MKVSIVIPVRDEARTIGPLLDSLFRQTRPPDEIVIVDGGSSDGTVRIVEAYQARHDRLKLVRARQAFPGEGRNLGVRAAAHPVIAFTDAGIILEPRWLEKLCEPMEQDDGTDVVYGHYEPLTPTFFTECAALAYVPPPSLRGARPIRAPSTASCLLRRKVWQSVGGFPPYRAAEDLVFFEAVERAGFRIAYAPEAIAYWQMAPDWTSTFRRFAVYSRHNLRAGRARYWHYGLARQYAAAVACLALAAAHSRWWALVPALGLLARTVRTAYRKRHAFAFRDVFRPRRLVCLAALLLLVDAATWWGSALWVWQDLLRGSGQPGGTYGYP